MWFLTQHKRWGLLKEHPDYLAVAKQINQIDLYKQAAAHAKISRAQGRRCARSKLIDGVVWDGKDPAKYADAFKIKVGRASLTASRRSPTMVSAVFHSPHAVSPAAPTAARRRASRAAACARHGSTGAPRTAAARTPFDWRGLLAQRLAARARAGAARRHLGAR